MQKKFEIVEGIFFQEKPVFGTRWMDTDALPIYGTAGVHFRTSSFTQIEVLFMTTP